VEGTLGPDYASVAISDCLAVYDGLSSPQHKCYAHHLRAVGAVLADRQSPYAEQWRQLLRAAIALKHGCAREHLRHYGRTRFQACGRSAVLIRAGNHLDRRTISARDLVISSTSNANVISRSPVVGKSGR
jgi:hypothetical protein